MARKRRASTPEFKAEAVELVTERGYSVAEAAVNPNAARSGHVVLVRPGAYSPAQGPTIAQAGRVNSNSMTLSGAFRPEQRNSVLFFAQP